ncbi:hypothetical protein [Coleofasciculus sp. LEGE 07092]|uniref:hypothetical protein n=1 Tax=Coleofasciculus sp. LEGE 07092 TaxID=2777969 RepID=UPI0018807AB8|nr:hypothetical protein [Coleofasciculus sp. LEGE 07092]MBE9147099.1 hypothetical protein [Coleofasciculus sp. LEGE 07092]
MALVLLCSAKPPSHQPPVPSHVNSMNDNNDQDDLKQLRDLLFTFGILFIFVFLVVWILLWAINVVPIRDSFRVFQEKDDPKPGILRE